MIKIRENFDKDNNCADKTDAMDRLRTGDLFIQNSEFESASAMQTDIAVVYTNVTDCASKITAAVQAEADTKINETNNAIVGEGATTKGADVSAFNGWSWGAINGKF